MKLFNLKLNGWVAAILVIIVVFAIYYLGLYNQIYDLYNKNLFEKNPFLCPDVSDCKITVTTPKYLAAFDDAPIYIVITNQDEKPFVGTLMVKGVYGNLNNETVCEEPEAGEPVFLTETKQAQYRNMISIDVDVPTNSVRIYVLYARLLDAKKGTNDIIFGYNWKNALGESESNDKVGQETLDASSHQPVENWSQYICSTYNSAGVFRELSVRYLLLPPFSTTFLPVISFFMVWLISGIMMQQNKSQTDKDKLTLQFMRIGFLAILYLIVGYGIIDFALIQNQKNSIWLFLLGFLFLVALFSASNFIIDPINSYKSCVKWLKDNINKCVKWLKKKNNPDSEDQGPGSQGPDASNESQGPDNQVSGASNEDNVIEIFASK